MGGLGGLQLIVFPAAYLLMLVNQKERECLPVPAWKITVETRVCVS